MSEASPKTEDVLDLRVLVIDDDPNEAEAAGEALERVGCACRIATSGTEGLELVRAGEMDVVLTDLIMQDVNGLEIVEETKKYWPDVEVLVITGHGSVDTAVKAMQMGAMVYLEKPLNIDVLRSHVKKAAEKQQMVRQHAALKRQIEKKFGFEGIVGQSQSMQRIFDVLGQISATSATVLIEGESGTGKELVARAIHNNSSRRARPFVALNCAALSEGILESELFGHEKGAFTGAEKARKGRFEYADQGTLFLDEVGDMPLSTQVKLLRVIEEGEILRVGSNEPVKVDVRLIAATNQNLAELVREKQFREDLYFRLNVVRLPLPPLRERADDIPLLIDTFLHEFADAHGKDTQGITTEALRILYRYPWPGNVRELKNCIEAMIVTSRSSMLGVEDVPAHISNLPESKSDRVAFTPGAALEEIEKVAIQQTLEMTNGNREEAARILKIGERTLYRKLDKYGLK